MGPKVKPMGHGKKAVKGSAKKLTKKTGQRSVKSVSPRKKSTTSMECPFTRAIKKIPRGAVKTFQEVALDAERQGMGGMMRASAVAHAIDSKRRDVPWWRVVYSGNTTTTPKKKGALETGVKKTGAKDRKRKKSGSTSGKSDYGGAISKPISQLTQKGGARGHLQLELLRREKVDVGRHGVVGKTGNVPDAEFVVHSSKSGPRDAALTKAKGALFRALEHRICKHMARCSSKGACKSGVMMIPYQFSLFTAAECNAVLAYLATSSEYDRTVRMDKHNFGRGIYHYLREPGLGTRKPEAASSSSSSSSSSPDVRDVAKAAMLGTFRNTLFQCLVPLARDFFQSRTSAGHKRASSADTKARLNADILSHIVPITTQSKDGANASKALPSKALEKFWTSCKLKSQTRSASLVLYYKEGGLNLPHQDIFGSVYFPFQVVVMLTKPGVDFKGGQFYTLDAVKGTQTKFNLKQGDVLIFHSSVCKHGMTKVESGKRAVFASSFHLAK